MITQKRLCIIFIIVAISSAVVAVLLHIYGTCSFVESIFVNIFSGGVVAACSAIVYVVSERSIHIQKELRYYYHVFIYHGKLLNANTDREKRYYCREIDKRFDQIQDEHGLIEWMLKRDSDFDKLSTMLVDYFYNVNNLLIALDTDDRKEIDFSWNEFYCEQKQKLAVLKRQWKKIAPKYNNKLVNDLEIADRSMKEKNAIN